jgi:hypothetical protein
VLTLAVKELLIPRTCRELSVGLTGHGVRSRGLLGGQESQAAGGPCDARARLSRVHPEDLARILAWWLRSARSPSKRFGRRHTRDRQGLAGGEDIRPLVGRTRGHRLGEAIDAIQLELGQATRRRSSVRRRSLPRPVTALTEHQMAMHCGGALANPTCQTCRPAVRNG